MALEILVVPFFGQGHLLPSMELCKHFASRNFRAVLVISSNLSSSVPSSLRSLPLVEVVEIPSSPTPPPPPPPSQPGSGDLMAQHRNHHSQMAQRLESVLSARASAPNSIPIACAVTDVMMSWTAEIFQKFRIPLVGFFTSGACSAAMEFAQWKAGVDGLKPGETRLLPGLPEEMALTEFDLKRRPHGPPHLRNGGGGPGGGGAPGGGGFPFAPPPGRPGPKFMGPPKPGQEPPWVDDVADSVALLFNTCDDLEGPFIEYLADRVGKPVWGVGPLLPEQYWRSAGSLLHDREIRTNRKSSITEDEVIQWLDSKPSGSVLYVSFGSEVGPTMEEYPQLAQALEESSSPFIWVIQPGSGRGGPPRTFLGGKPDSDPDKEGYFPHGLKEKVGDRGLIIRGWAPQLLILSHPSTGGFLSHCGWNSTVEAIGRGVPFLTWPIRGDQYHNAKLVVAHLRMGHVILDDMSLPMKKDDIVKGIERLMGDEGVKERAAQLGKRFEGGFPASSAAGLDAFAEFIRQKTK
ncbi:UDP-glycosyltransferase 73B5-like [Punica granatum]|uniref:UDP-glycosyltransferase 73B5-like n=2 Tax=Punica granatum TaxID=22663 RepID=A0A218VXK6_PUNGR|nr:UDP-glycosyltransferase 73B5-like [Punica granatum]OWM65009.1 hypothetical protein CDL15_Pgr028727 [Punica granatum]